MTQAQFRTWALALPGAVEGAHHDHPDFRCRGRIFASLHPNGRQAMVKLLPAQQRARLADAAFTPANGAWGRAGCTMVDLASAGPASVEAALTDAWQNLQALGAGQRKAAARPKRR